jgi:hypothetical protein
MYRAAIARDTSTYAKPECVWAGEHRWGLRESFASVSLREAANDQTDLAVELPNESQLRSRWRLRTQKKHLPMGITLF